MGKSTDYAYHIQQPTHNPHEKAPNHFCEREVRSFLLYIYEHPITSVCRDGQMKELSSDFTVDHQKTKNGWLSRKSRSYIDLLRHFYFMPKRF